MQRKGKNESPERRISVRIAVVLFILIVFAIVIWRALSGKIAVTGSFPVAIKTESLTCTASRVAYSKLGKDSNANSNVRVIGVFNNQGELLDLSFDYMIDYDSHEAAEAELATFRATFGLNLADDGLSFTEFGNKFTLYNNRITLSLFGDSTNLTKQAAPYFLLGSDSTDRSSVPSSLTGFKVDYEKQGYACTSSISD